jgi:Scaffold protein Nfu/NifU N terminal
MKFTLDVTLPERIDTTRGEGVDTPFAQAMLEFDGVASVFGINDFVTITREADADWDAIVCAVEDAAAAHLGESDGAPADDALDNARKLLRNAVAPPKPRPVEIGHPPDRDT